MEMKTKRVVKDYVKVQKKLIFNKTDTVLLCGIVIIVAALLRLIISMHPFSGERSPPMFGDFEAQRHWQEITVNLPISVWYENTTDNNLMYWGLDYPPLTAYHSWAIGQWAKHYNASYVELFESRGISEPTHKNFMRNSVLLVDLLLYIPAVLLCVYSIENINKRPKNFEFIKYCGIVLFYPGQILIDNGHFQYNNVSLGLAAIAIASILNEFNIVGAFFFTLALNYKQMELYHALPFFWFLLGNCLQNHNNSTNTMTSKMLRLLSIATTVVLTFVIIWLPWLSSWQRLIQVINRIFPIARGVFEDKVSNIWCVANVFIKIKEHFSNALMAKLCLGLTILTTLPSGLWLTIRPTKHGFLLALINSSLSFFLFSFQVHEKSILLVSLPVFLYYPFNPKICFWFLQISTISMFPLLHKDNLIYAFVGIMLFYHMYPLLFPIDVKTENINNNKRLDQGYILSMFGACILAICFMFVNPPEKLPHLFSLMLSTYCCGHFLLFLVYFNYQQFSISKNVIHKKKIL